MSGRGLLECKGGVSHLRRGGWRRRWRRRTGERSRRRPPAASRRRRRWARTRDRLREGERGERGAKQRGRGEAREARGGGGGWRDAGERRTVDGSVNARARRRQVRVVRHATHRAAVLATGLAPGQAPRRRRRRPPLLAAQGRRPRRLGEVRAAALAARLALEGGRDGGGEVERRRALVAGTRRASLGRLRRDLTGGCGRPTAAAAAEEAADDGELPGGAGFGGAGAVGRHRVFGGGTPEGAGTRDGERGVRRVVLVALGLVVARRVRVAGTETGASSAQLVGAGHRPVREVWIPRGAGQGAISENASTCAGGGGGGGSGGGAPPAKERPATLLRTRPIAPRRRARAPQARWTRRAASAPRPQLHPSAEPAQVT